MNYSYYKIKEYIIYIEANDNAITKVKLVDNYEQSNNNNIIDTFILELDEYFNGTLKTFNSPIEINYLQWRKKLYQKVKDIQYGAQIQLKNLVEMMGLTKGNRAVARALNDNPLIIIIPCHRVNSVVRTFKAHSYSKEFRNFLLEIEK